jgi:hypothetical protein
MQMRDQKVPDIPTEFSPWVRWCDRNKPNKLTDTDKPGVYLLAKFPDTFPDPAEPADPLADQVIYIGETCTSLTRRWSMFERSAFQGKFGHSGGATYRETYCDQQNGCYDQGTDLWVSAFVPPVTLDQDKWPFFIKYIERRLIWEYVQVWNRAPSCNHKMG